MRRLATCLSLVGLLASLVWTAESLQVTYAPGLNVYRPQTGNVELQLEGADDLVDATSVIWEVKPLVSVLGGSQPASQVLASSSLAGVATFQPGQRQTNISIPVAWEAVKEGDIRPFGLELYSLPGSSLSTNRSSPTRSDRNVAFTIFGIPEGTCPPGTAVYKPWHQSVLSTPTSTSLTKSSSDLWSIADLARAALGLDVQVVVPLSDGDWKINHSDENSTTNNGTFVVPLSGRVSVNATTNTSQAMAAGLINSTWSSAVLCALGGDQDLELVAVNGMDFMGTQEEDDSRDDNDDGRATIGQNRTAVSLCGCNATMLCTAWSIPLSTGPNAFELSRRGVQDEESELSVTTKSIPQVVAADDDDTDSTSSSHELSNSLRLELVRLAPPTHVALASLNVTLPSGKTTILCGNGNETAWPQQQDSVQSSSVQEYKSRYSAVGPGSSSSNDGSDSMGMTATSSSSSFLTSCTPGSVLDVTLPATAEFVSLSAALAHSDVTGIRVEVGGQVLAHSGNDAAILQQDTATTTGGKAPSSTQNGADTTVIGAALPSAFILGLNPSADVHVDVVVAAEDGVSSAVYPIRLRCDQKDSLELEEALESSNPSPDSEELLAEVVTEHASSSSSLVHGAGFYPGTSLLSVGAGVNCTVCPAGWSSGNTNAPGCDLCPPGTVSSGPGSSTCAPCSPGSYSYAWGATACRHCIAGSFSDTEGSTLCTLCDGETLPANRDGATSCSSEGSSSPSSSSRFAVVVSFAVMVAGIDVDAAVLRAGVNTSPENIVAALLRADTAAAFNVSLNAVQVCAGDYSSRRRTLRAQVSASVGVEVPDNATDVEIVAALEVGRLSADVPIAWLSDDPDSFFSRTTQTLQVSVTAGDTNTAEVRPGYPLPSLVFWPLLGPGIALVCLALVILLPFAPFRRSSGMGKCFVSTAKGLALSPRRYLSSRLRSTALPR